MKKGVEYIKNGNGPPGRQKPKNPFISDSDRIQFEKNLKDKKLVMIDNLFLNLEKMQPKPVSSDNEIVKDDGDVTGLDAEKLKVQLVQKVPLGEGNG